MRAVSVGEAKNRLTFYLHLAEKGESIEITRHGKIVAMINGLENASVYSKKKRFLAGIKNWREKYSEVLFTNEEIDSIFKRDYGESAFEVRHPEDFLI